MQIRSCTRSCNPNDNKQHSATAFGGKAPLVGEPEDLVLHILLIMLRVKAVVVIFYDSIITNRRGKKRVLMKKFFYLCLGAAILTSCDLEDEDYDDFNPSDPYIFILNEGNYGQGNSDISYVNLKDEVYNGMFEVTNARPLGDVGQSISVMGNYFYIPMNGSGKIEVVNYNTYTSVATIEAPDGEYLTPQYVQFTSGYEAVMSDLYSTQMAILDVNSHIITGFFEVGAGTGRMALVSGNLYVAKYNSTSWSYDQLMVIDPSTKTITTEIETPGMSGTELIVDAAGMIWAMTSTEFVCINPSTNSIVRSLALPADVQYNNWTSDCGLSTDGNTIVFNAVVGMDYTTYTGGACNVYSFNINDSSISETPLFVASDVVTPYNLEVSPNNEICITDAVDYSQSGILHIYDMTGSKTNEYVTGVCPNDMVFVDYD